MITQSPHSAKISQSVVTLSQLGVGDGGLVSCRRLCQLEPLAPGRFNHDGQALDKRPANWCLHWLPDVKYFSYPTNKQSQTRGQMVKISSSFYLCERDRLLLLKCHDCLDFLKYAWTSLSNMVLYWILCSGKCCAKWSMLRNQICNFNISLKLYKFIYHSMGASVRACAEGRLDFFTTWKCRHKA